MGLKQIILSFINQESSYFSIRILGRGEEVDYKDNKLILIIDRTYCGSDRFYCDSFKKDKIGKFINLENRLVVIDNLCKYFKSKKKKLIFVVDENDIDKDQIIEYIELLKINNHKLSVELDSDKKREQSMDREYRDSLLSGASIEIDGERIINIDEYEIWRLKNKPK